MNRSSEERGIALVVTLIMLSIVTFMAVVFLSVSRRERASVGVTSDLVSARMMADSASARAEAEILARIMATTNLLNYDLVVSTNFINPLGFQANNGASPTNVSYVYSNGQPLSSKDDLLQNLANLIYEPRPPVYIQTNQNGAMDFRYFLDFNRNGRFETNGLATEVDRQGAPVLVNGEPLTNNYVGDPEWIGVLENSGARHSSSNRFIGRFAYLVAPAGKSLDANHIHNHAKRVEQPGQMNLDGFYRNQGVGTWELNLAGFLTALNTNSWLSYGYLTNTSQANVGAAFDDARSILRYRYYNGADYRLPSALETFGPAGNFFRIDGIDNYSDGPLDIFPHPHNYEQSGQAGLTDNVREPWAGADNWEAYFDVQELLDPNKTSLPFAQRMMLPQLASQATYDRYTFYRMLSQLSVDSSSRETAEVFHPDFRRGATNVIHINYRNDIPGGAANFVNWLPQDFFTRTAERIIRMTLKTNITEFQPQTYQTNFLLGTTLVGNYFSVTNMQLFPTNEYTAETHRLLQVAANIYDATTNRTVGTSSNLPSLFRPTFLKTDGVLYINGYVEERDSRFLSYPWMPMDEVMRQRADGIHTNLNIFGVPAVIGAKKGYPNFNEVALRSAVNVHRKLEVNKGAVDAPASAWRTNQMYVIGITNLFGVEGWNSYTQDYNRPFELRITNRYSVVLMDDRWSTNQFVRESRGMMSARIQDQVWTNQTFQTVMTNVTFLPNAAYVPPTLTGGAPAFTFAGNTNFFTDLSYIPQWRLLVTNRLQYIMIDRTSGQVVDLVNLDNLVSNIDISGQLGGQTNSAGSTFAGGGGIGGSSQPFTEGMFWDTRRLAFGDPLAPTIGITNQIGVALGVPEVNETTWRSYANDPASGRDKERAIEKFQRFLDQSPISDPEVDNSARYEVPFTPTRRLGQNSSWQANDPLVHYTVGDLVDPLYSTTNNLALNLGHVNDRYEPWGVDESDPTSYDYGVKDAGIRRPDDWMFPTNKFASVGRLGQVHRGTPWQTIYMKSRVIPMQTWAEWSQAPGSHPTNDWNLMDLFTTAPNDNAVQGQLSVNQSGMAAWSAVLSGLAVLTNSVPAAELFRNETNRLDPAIISPRSFAGLAPQIQRIVNGINAARSARPNGVFETKGAILSTPELSDYSPYLNFDPNLHPTADNQRLYGLTDAAYERIPQLIMSLLKRDEPRLVIYGFGQSLEPAPRSLVTTPGFFNICTNYQITGEVVTKTVVRIEPVNEQEERMRGGSGINPFNQAKRGNAWRTVVESYEVLPPE